ncbi:MAG: DUF296 domain-containing protein [Alphaproteobacteria bacterium]
MRTAMQPGPALEPRILIAEARATADLRLVVAEGTDLLDGLKAALLARGIRNAAIALGGGRFSRMQYLTGQIDPTGARVATYGEPTPVEDAALISGNAILGQGVDGADIVHCHAVVVDRQGRVHGGHLPPGTCIVGPGGISAWATAHDGGGFRAAYDPETNYPIFQPVPLEPS